MTVSVMSQTTGFRPYVKPRMPRMTMALDTTMPQTLERPEALKSDSVDDDDDNDTALRSDSSIDGTPIQLPQRPDVAVTRDVHWFSPRQRTKSMSPSHLMPITNHGLALASVPLHVKEIGPAPRSEDRVRAAQRMFHTVANSTRRSQKPRSNDRARPSLSPNPRQKTMLHDPSKDPLEFVPTMDGTQHCVIATDRNTFEMVVTPPSPRPDEHEWERGSVVTGVSITSHKMAQSLPPQQPTLTLQPPPFELAPGRALQLARRIKQTGQQAQIHQQARESEVASVRTSMLHTMRKYAQHRQKVWQCERGAKAAAAHGTSDRYTRTPVAADDIMAYIARWNRGANSPTYIPPNIRRMAAHQMRCRSTIHT